MNELVIKQLEPVMLPLVQKFYKDNYPAGKAKKNELIYVAYVRHTLVAVVRFREIDRWRLLTGMVVLPGYRDQGIGHKIMAYLETNEMREGDYCFAFEHLQNFYSRHGFKTLPTINNVPAPLCSLYKRYLGSGKKLSLMKFEKFTQN